MSQLPHLRPSKTFTFLRTLIEVMPGNLWEMIFDSKIVRCSGSFLISGGGILMCVEGTPKMVDEVEDSAPRSN